MKKRILSLLLAFAMAATLAPATALVGSNTAKADPDQVLTDVPRPDLSVNGSPIGATPFDVYPGQKIEVTIKDNTTGATGDEVNITRTVSGSGFSAGTAEASLKLTRTTTTSSKDSIEVSKTANAGDVFTVTYGSNYKFGTGTGNTPFGSVSFKVNALTYTGNAATIGHADSVTANVSTNKIVPSTLATTTLVINSGQNGTTFTQAKDAKVQVRKLDGNGDLKVEIGAATTNSAIASAAPTVNTGNVTFNFDAIKFSATTANTGDYTYEITHWLSLDGGTSYKEVTKRYITVTTAAVNEAILDADGGVVSDVNWELKDGKYVGAAKANADNWDVVLPIARKEGYVFKNWVNTTTGATYNAGATAAAVAIPSFKANYDKFTTYKIYSGISTSDTTGATGSGADGADYGATVKTVANRNLGDKIANAEDKFSRAGYTFLGFSTELGARKALWGPDATLTNEVVQAMESTRKADGSFALYCVWAAKSYEIRYEKNMGPTGVPLPGSTDVAPQTKTIGTNIAPRACTWAWEGHTFMHWALATTNVTDNTANVDANNDDVLSDAELGNADFSKGYVVLRAVWNNDGPAQLYQNDSKFWKSVATSSSLPLFTPEVGKVAEKWVDGEGTTVNAGATPLVANRTYKPTYEKLVSFPIDYVTSKVVIGNSSDPVTATGIFGNIEHSNSDQTAFTVGSATTTVTGYTANTLADASVGGGAISEATFKGVVYEIGGKYVQPDYTLGALSTAMTSKTFNNAKMAALLWKANAVSPTDYTVAGGAYKWVHDVKVYPIFAAKVTGAFVYPDVIEVKYGTPIDVLLSDILDADGTNFGLMGTPSGLAAKKIATGAYSSSISIVNNGGYNPIPDTEKEYVITVRVTPGFGTDPNASYYDKQVRVVVRQGTDAEKLQTFALTTTLPTITLEAGANAYDVYAALSKVNVFANKATDGKSYNFDMAEVGPTTGTTPKTNISAAGKSEWQLDGTTKGDNLEFSNLANTYTGYNTAFTGAKTFFFRVNRDSEAIDGPDGDEATGNPGLAYQSQTTPGAMAYNCKYAVVQINVGAGSIAPFKPAETVTEDNDERPAIAAGPVYRLYNPHNGDHLFTTSKGERNTLAAIGWQVDAVTFNTPASTDENAIPVYRVYNPISGEHFYTTSKGERNKLVSVDKWRYEGVEFYAYSAKSKLGVPVYRLWSPTSTDAGSHHFTGSKGEYNSLGKIGWNQEGVAFRAVKAN